MYKQKVTGSIKITFGLFLLGALSGCVFMQKLFQPEPTQQEIKARRVALVRSHRLSLRNKYRVASVLQTDLTKGAAKRNYILSDGERYRG